MSKNKIDNYELDLTLNVMNHRAILMKYAHNFIVRLLNRVNTHDDSKLREPELSLFSSNAREFYEGKTYYDESYIELKKSVEIAIQNHYAHNRHHPEHFEDGINDMNILDILEMLLDWIASNDKYDNNIENVVEMLAIQKERFHISDQLHGILILTAKMLLTDPTLELNEEKKNEKFK